MKQGASPSIHMDSSDPFYRYAARRYWRKWRFAMLLCGIVAWCLCSNLLVPAFFGCYVLLCHLCKAPCLSDLFLCSSASKVFVGAIMSLLVLRVPLTLMALLGGTTAFWQDKDENRLEQFVVTPIEPWRFALARLHARIDSLKTIWWGAALLLGLLSLGCLMAKWGNDLTEGVILVAIMAVLHLDLALMIRVDAYLGLRFSASCRTRTGSLVWALPIGLLLLPLATLTFSGAIGSFGGKQLVAPMGAKDAVALAEVCGLGLFLLARLVLGGLALVLIKRSAQRQVKTLFAPES
jgi:hypothetical protein